jgi:ParB family chromosome partitioning protein
MTRKNLKFEINPLLSGPSLDARNRSGSPYRVIPINDIDVDPDQPRRSFDSESIAELASSIEAYGLLCPILVKLNVGGTYKLVSGERRLRARKALGLDTIAAIIDAEDGDVSVTLAKQLVENIQRTDLNPMEKALAMGQMRDRFTLSVREIASQLGISKSSAQRSLELLELPDDLQAALISGASESKIIALSKVKDLSKRKKLLENLEKMSRMELEALIEPVLKEKVSHGGTVPNVANTTFSLEDKRIEEDLQRALGLKVSLKRDKSKLTRGKITIDFYSSSDVNEIYKRLNTLG